MNGSGVRDVTFLISRSVFNPAPYHAPATVVAAKPTARTTERTLLTGAFLDIGGVVFEGVRVLHDLIVEESETGAKN